MVEHDLRGSAKRSLSQSMFETGEAAEGPGAVTMRGQSGER